MPSGGALGGGRAPWLAAGWPRDARLTRRPTAALGVLPPNVVDLRVCMFQAPVTLLSLLSLTTLIYVPRGNPSGIHTQRDAHTVGYTHDACVPVALEVPGEADRLMLCVPLGTPLYTSGYVQYPGVPLPVRADSASLSGLPLSVIGILVRCTHADRHAPLTCQRLNAASLIPNAEMLDPMHTC